MVEEIVTPQVISQARRHATAPSARLIMFPDGITRHITLPGWQWSVLDRFDRENSLVKAARIIAMAFEGAKEDLRYPDEPFEATIRYHLSVCLTESVAWSSDYIPRRANDG